MDEKKDEKRDEKGRFKKGFSGGPGRGKKSLRKLTIEEVELALTEDLRSKDPRVRLPATRLLLQLKRQFPDQDDRPLLDPSVQRYIDSKAVDLGSDPAVIDADYEIDN